VHVSSIGDDVCQLQVRTGRWGFVATKWNVRFRMGEHSRRPPRGFLLYCRYRGWLDRNRCFFTVSCWRFTWQMRGDQIPARNY